MVDLTTKKSFTISSADLKAHHTAALAELKLFITQSARTAELEDALSTARIQLDGARVTVIERGKRIAELEAEVARLREIGDSQYRAPALAGWNAAQIEDPAEAARKIAQLRRVEPGVLAAIRERWADDEWACRGGSRVHCHVFCTCDGSKAEEIDPRL